jgi:hypothetical protein
MLLQQLVTHQINVAVVYELSSLTFEASLRYFTHETHRESETTTDNCSTIMTAADTQQKFDVASISL